MSKKVIKLTEGQLKNIVERVIGSQIANNDIKKIIVKKR